MLVGSTWASTIPSAGIGATRSGVTSRSDRGQTSILFAIVLMVIAVVVSGLVAVGAIADSRAQARSAADAIALADHDAAVVSYWQNRGVTVQRLPDGAEARVGDARARSHVVAERIVESPALHAIMARAEQLLGQSVGYVFDGDTAIVIINAPAGLASTLNDFGLCLSSDGNGTTRAQLC